MRKKVLSGFSEIMCIVLSLVLSVQLFGVCAVAITEIHEGETSTVTLSAGESKVFRFRPVRTAKLDFYSSGNLDPHAYLYDEESQIGGGKDTAIQMNDDVGTDPNFKISYNFTNGDTFYFEVMLCDEQQSGTFSVTLGAAHECNDADGNGKCDICGKTMSGSTVCDHKNTEKVGETAPTCTAEGNSGDTVCKDCGKLIFQGSKISALGHDSGKWITAKTATATEKGIDELRCTRCNALLSTRETDHRHEFIKSKTVEATCTDEGYTVYKCACGAEEKHDTKSALGHDSGKWITVKAATATEKGTDELRCTRCGSVIDTRETTHIHSFIKGKTVAPTCLKDGYTVYTCACGAEEKKDTVPAQGHNAVDYSEGREATCEKTGITCGKKCSVCGVILENQQIIPKKEHNFSSWQIVKEATCTKAGEKEQTCSLCGKTEKVEIPALGHLFSEWETVKVATCTDSGEKRRECSRCKLTESETVSYAHLFTDWTVTKEATCSEKGEKSRKCINCGFEEKQETEVSHIFSEWLTVKEVTCTENGERTRKCSICKLEEKETVEAKGHSFGEWEITKQVGCTESGEKVRKCSVCTEEEKETIPFTGHNFDKIEITRQANCNTKGEITSHCKLCGKDIVTNTDIVPDAHAYSDWKTEREADHSSSGLESCICENCGDIKTRVIPQIKHTFDNRTVSATFEKNGRQEVYCTECGYVDNTESIRRIDASSVKLSKKSYVYDGKTHKPSVTVRDYNGNLLVKGEDYSVKYSSGRKKAGSYTAEIIFTGKYSGNKKLSFSIKPGAVSSVKKTVSETQVKLSWKSVPGATGYRVFKYSSSEKKYVKVGDTANTEYIVKKLKGGTKYSFAVKAYTKNSDGKTVWSDTSFKLTAVTKPGTPSVSLKASSKSISVKYAKVNGASKYEIYVREGKSGSYRKIKTTSKTACSFKAEKGKTYYVKVRAYKTVNSEKLYSSYSSVKKCKAAK